MGLLRFITFFTLIFFTTAQGMQKADKKQDDLDWSLLDACKNIENPATCSEFSVAALHCSSVTTRRFKGIKNALNAGANPNRLMKGKDFTPFHWAVMNNSPALVALLLKNGADAKIVFDRSKLRKPEPPITTLGLALVNYMYIDERKFNDTSLRHTQAAEVPLKSARENNIAIRNMLIEAGVQAQGENEVRVATIAYENEHRRAGHKRTSAAFY